MVHGLAGAQVHLDFYWEPDGPYSDEAPAKVLLNIERADVSADPDSDVTAMGFTWTLPDGWTLARDANNNCAPAVVETHYGAPINPAEHPLLFVKGANLTYLDPPTNTQCAPLPATGRVLEFNWIPGGGENPLPLVFPLTVELKVWAPGLDFCEVVESDAQLRYRVGDGGEQTASGNGGDVIWDCYPFPPGDVNSDSSVDPLDAQLCFEAFLQIPEALAIVNTYTGDFCIAGDGLDPRDAQGIFNEFLQLPDPCN